MATTSVPVKQTAAAPGVTVDVWRPFRSEIERMFDRFANGFGLAPFAAARFDPSIALPSPAVDIIESETGFTLSAELPGMTEKDVELSLVGDTLAIKGEKRQEREEKDENFHLTERSYGAFQRSFLLPESVDREHISAAFANGVLTVTLPKTALAAPKKIEVKPAG
jgi:HSP20 family protein